MDAKLQNVVQRRLAELDLGPIAAATAAGMERTFIRDIVDGRKTTVRQSSLAKLAKALQWTPQQLSAALEGLPPGVVPEVTTSSSPLVPVRLQGTVEAGAWRDAEDLNQDEPVLLYEPRDPDFPQARMMAFDVSGTSMNALKPRPILPGDRVIAVDFEDTGLAVREGMVAIVRQTRAGGQLIEWSIKQVALFDDRIELQPRSTEAKHKPIVVTRDLQADDGRVVEIIGLVRRISNDVPLGW